jgi:O-antigen ligase
MNQVIANKWAAPQAFAPAPVPVQLEANPMQKVAYGLTAFFIFMLYSRVQDFVFFLHLPAITMSLATLWTVISGNLRVVTRMATTKWSLAMTFCMFAAIPFSVWPGGALQTIFTMWLKSFLVFAVVVSTIVIPRYCTRLMAIAAFGILCGTVVGLITGSSVEGRMTEASARFGDSNEFAQVLLIGMCLMFGYSSTPGRNMVMKLIAYASVLIMLISFFRTGSRGGFIGLVVVVLFVFIKDSVATKAGIAVLAILLATLLLIFLPPQLKYRYGVLLGLVADNSMDTQAIAAAGSKESREYLLMQSLSITAHHPLLGVGAGQFAVAENSVAVSEGLARGSWHETHNMYTQVSAENGIPALIFFLATLVVSFRTLNRVALLGKNTSDLVLLEASKAAYWLRLGLLAIIASGFFLSIAYTNELQVIVAFAMGLNYSVNTYLQTVQAQTMAPAPAAPANGMAPGYRKPIRVPAAYHKL